jgi:hypothetical protein
MPPNGLLGHSMGQTSTGRESQLGLFCKDSHV